MIGTIRLRDTALEEIIHAAWETKDVESGGYLYGRFRKNGNWKIWDVNLVHTSQLVKRTPNAINSMKGCERDCYHFYLNIGDFHYHPTSRVQKNGVRKIDPGRVYLGKKADLPYLKQRLDEVEIVIAIRRAKKLHDLSVTDYLHPFYLKDEDSGKVYRVEIGGYYIHANKKRRAKMVISKRASNVVWW